MIIKRFKNLIVSLLFFIACLSPTFSLTKNKINLVSAAEMQTVAQIQQKETDISNLLTLRTESMLRNDQETYDKITLLLTEYGVENMSEQDLISFAALTDDHFVMPNAEGHYSDNAIITEYAHNVFERYSQDFTHNGVEYTYMNIIATPKTSDSALVKSGVIVDSKKNQGLTATTSVLSTLASTAAGIISSVAEIVLTLGEIISDISLAFSNLSETDNIDACYIWSAAETCSFTYVYIEDEGIYKCVWLANQVSTSIRTEIPGIIYNESTGKCTPDVYDMSQTGNYKSKYFANGYKAACESIDCDIEKVITQIPSFNIYGIDEKKLSTIQFRNPNTPVDIGFQF